jgi:threonine-phosphate decarboxylase
MKRIPREWPDPAPLFVHGDRTRGAAGPGLDFSVTVNPLGPPPSVVQALRAGLGAIARYPDAECRQLAERLALRHGCDRSQVIVGNGANDLIYTLTRAVRPRCVAIAEPTYTEYLRAALLAGADVTHWLAEGPDFEPEPFDPQGADLVWLCNPNNPTGRLWPERAGLASWVRAHPRTLFVVDEAFLPLALQGTGGEERSAIPAAARLANLVVLRSLTKFYALPGLRLGYAVAPSEWAERVRTQVVPWSVNALAQVAGLAALSDEDYALRTRAWLASEAQAFAGRLAHACDRLRPVRSEASFVLLQLRGLMAATVVERLARQGITVRDASNFVGLAENYLRISARTAEENERLLEALARL